MEYPDTLMGTATPCESMIPDGILNNYTDVTTCACTYCAAVCSAPVVDDVIGFLDGFNGKTVGYSYIGFVSFTILYQLSIWVFRKK